MTFSYDTPLDQIVSFLFLYPIFKPQYFNNHVTDVALCYNIA